jgi:D-arginine utilization repressor
MSFSLYVPLCNAIVLLLDPLVEIVIHNLESGTICFITGSLSKRKVGDASLLECEALEKNLDVITYPKLNFDGRLIKSISIPVDEKLLICINCDVSVFSQMQQLSQSFLTSNQAVMPDSLFKKDWQEKLHSGIHTYLNEKAWRFDSLTQKQKKDVVYYLYHQQAFTEKNAADYIATVLGLGRATIFNYLKSWRQTK